MRALVDEKVLRALNEGQGDLNVFVKLTPSGSDPGARAAEVVQRVANKTRATPKFDFRDLDSVLHVQGNRNFISELLKQPEIASASLVPNLESAFIAPQNPRDISESEINEPAYPERHIPKAPSRK